MDALNLQGRPTRGTPLQAALIGPAGLEEDEQGRRGERQGETEGGRTREGGRKGNVGRKEC